MACLATVAPFGFETLDTRTLLPLYHRLGCRACQFYRNVANQPRVEDVLAIVADAGLTLDSIHGVFGPQYDPSSPSEPERQFAMTAYRSEAELAVSLDAPKIVVHPGPQMPDGTAFFDPSPERRAAALKRSFDDLAKIADEMGVRFLIENLPPNFLAGGDPPQLAAMIRDFDHPRIRMCFDTGHAHISGEAAEALQQSIDVIDYLHISDNDARKDSHLVPGKGTCPFDEMASHIAKLDHTVSAMLELFESPRSLEGHLASGLADRLADWFATDAHSTNVNRESA